MPGYSVCFIGNSHLAAVAQAWRADRLGAHKHVSLVFFGARAGTLRLEFEDGRFAPTKSEVAESWRRTSGGQGSIRPGEHDAVVIYGMGFRLSGLFSMFSDYGTAADLAWGPVKHLISGGCMKVLMHSAITGGIVLDILGQMKAATSAPVLVCPMPFRSETALGGPIAAHPRLSNVEFLSRVVREFETEGTGICAKVGGIFVPQPESTWALPCFTKAEFTLGGDNWKGTKQGADDKHMNAQYGAIMLGRILQQLNVLSGGRVMDRRRENSERSGALEVAE